MTQLDFSKNSGLVTAIAVDDETGEVLMTAYMNAEAWDKTLSTGEVYYWSRSRNKLWKKGEESGNIQRVKEIRIDCDADAVLIRVEQLGSAEACHTGHKKLLLPRTHRWRFCKRQPFGI